MHLVVILLVIVIVGFLIYRNVTARTDGQDSASAAGAAAGTSDRALAFLSNGLIFFRERAGELRQLQSPYVQESIDRRERARARHGWKEGTTFGVAAGGNARSFEAADKPVLATSAAFDINGDLLYFLRDASIGGLFRRESASGKESRLLLRQNLHLSDLCVSPDGVQIAASSQQADAVANIVVFDTDGSKYREATGGDTVDTGPAWIPGSPDRLLFQSAGLARDEQGYIVAQGPASIQMLDMVSGSVKAVLEDSRFDFIKPRVCPQGNLHFIRRPYEAPRYETSTFLADLLMFPFRLLRAVFHYLNFFSLMYTRKPLTSANGPSVKADVKNILLQGRRIDAEKALRNERSVHGVPSLVPGSWELVVRSRDGDERVVANNVASYDIGPDGAIVYSNGRGVFVVTPDGRPALAVRDELVSEVFASAA